MYWNKVEEEESVLGRGVWVTKRAVGTLYASRVEGGRQVNGR